MKGKKSLPVVNEDLVLPPSKGHFFANCFAGHSERDQAIRYHVRGLANLHAGYWATDAQERKILFNNAFGLFNLALKFDPTYFCSREALSHAADLVGEDWLEGGEKYKNDFAGTPVINEFSPQERNNPEYVCHLLHPGSYNAAQLEEMLQKYK